ncbi:hypothetical protein [Methylobacterium soli]|uniref:Uncharacterized protein n=1 Tax=Methylobacterium soli TaxID=553447 RepID=A0A6L3SWY7_9HYPH|nr:hypothetical protein [Methylobacterium soli]KAB1078386.1 hypothetical protein F6X53_14970 [Methylobacterium soli]GJE45802.1 hypothetical protein AEGHOMDF_5002 [Methylobacterium soli]
MGAGNRERPLDFGQELPGMRLLLVGKLGDQADLPRPALLGLSNVSGRNVQSGFMSRICHDRVGWIGRRRWMWAHFDEMLASTSP